MEGDHGSHCRKYKRAGITKTGDVNHGIVYVVGFRTFLVWAKSSNPRHTVKELLTEIRACCGISRSRFIPSHDIYHIR